MKIKDLVKNKRKQLNESQKEFGKRFGKSHAAISDMENGKTKSIDEDMINFIITGCEHRRREYRKTVITTCLDCGYEQEDNIKIK